MDFVHEFFTALSSNTEGLADGAYSFLKALWNIGGDFVLGSSAPTPVDPDQTTTIPAAPLEPAIPTTPDADPAE